MFIRPLFCSIMMIFNTIFEPNLLMLKFSFEICQKFFLSVDLKTQAMISSNNLTHTFKIRVCFDAQGRPRLTKISLGNFTFIYSFASKVRALKER